MNFTNQQIELLANLTRINRSENENQDIIKYSNEIKDWESFYQLCKLNRHAPFAYKELDKLNLAEKIPTNTKELFLSDVKRIEETNKKRLEEAQNFLKRFSEKGVETIILKGIFYGETFYKDPYYKRMNDVDILIHQKDLDKIFDVYTELKYFSGGELLGKPARDHDQFSHHLPPFFSRNLNLMIGTHWELHTPLRPYRLDYKGIWERAVDFDFYGIPMKSLAPIDHLHHLCVHLSFFKAGAREVGDMINLLRANKDFDWGHFLKEVDKAGSHNPVYLGLSLANILDPHEDKEAALKKIKPRVASKTISLVTEKRNSREILLTTRSGHITKIDKAFTGFKSTKKPFEKFRFYLEMYKHMYFPPLEDAKRITNTLGDDFLSNLMARIKAPFRIMSSLCDDLGTKIFFLLLLYTFVKMITTFLKAPFSGNSEGQEEFAKKLGLSIRDLELLKERLE